MGRKGGCPFHRGGCVAVSGTRGRGRASGGTCRPPPSGETGVRLGERPSARAPSGRPAPRRLDEIRGWPSREVAAGGWVERPGPPFYRRRRLTLHHYRRWLGLDELLVLRFSIGPSSHHLLRWTSRHRVPLSKDGTTSGVDNSATGREAFVGG